MGFGKENIREVIAETAKDFLLVKNPDEITMFMVAKELDITPVTLYHYFGGKDEIIKAGYEMIISEIVECVDIRFPVTLSSSFKLKIILKNLCDYFYRTGLNATWLVEDPSCAPVSLQFVRNIVFDLVLKLFNCDENDGMKITYRYLALIQAEILYHKKKSKPLPENTVENVFKIVNRK